MIAKPMRRAIRTLALALPIASWASATQAEPVAVLAAVKGKVEVVPAHRRVTERASFGRALERGDRLVVAPGAAATVFFSDGNVIDLAERSTITVGGRIASGAHALPNAELPGEVYAQVCKFVTTGSRQTGLIASPNMRGGPEDRPALIVAPRSTDLLTGRPSFSWLAVPSATRYRVTVADEHGEVWSREVEGLALDYPADQAALKAGGDFLWEVHALGAGGELRKDDTMIHVCAAEQADSVSANLGKIAHCAGGSGTMAAEFLSGSYLFARGLYGDAAAHFEALGKLSPDSPAPHEALGNLYRAVGLTDLAAAEHQKALALTRRR